MLAYAEHSVVEHYGARLPQMRCTPQDPRILSCGLGMTFCTWWLVLASRYLRPASCDYSYHNLSGVVHFPGKQRAPRTSILTLASLIHVGLKDLAPEVPTAEHDLTVSHTRLSYHYHHHHHTFKSPSLGDFSAEFCSNRGWCVSAFPIRGCSIGDHPIGGW